jgi:phosphatidylglycerophosphate synthase
LPLALRAAFAAIDAGCTEIELAQGGAAPPAWTADARLSRPVVAPRAVEEERLLLRADAVVAPALLRELPRGHAACDAAGVRVAARVSLAPDADPAAALAAAPVHAFTEGRYCYAIAVTSAAARRAATRALLASLVKTSDGPVSVHVNRPISLALTRVLVPLGVSANQMTFVTALVAFAGAWFAAQAGWHAQALGAVLFQASSVLDGCDGEIARLKYQESALGCWIETFGDYSYYIAIFVGMTVGAVRFTGMPIFYWFGIVAMAGTLITFAMLIYLRTRITAGRPERLHSIAKQRFKAEPTWWSRIIWRISFVATRSAMPYGIMALALVGLTPLVVVLAAIGSNVYWISLFLKLRHLLGETAQETVAA